VGLLRRRGPCALLPLLAWGSPAFAADWEMALDLRAVSSDGHESFLDNGLGKLRFDEDHQGLQLGRARFAWNQPLGEVFFAHAEASIWDGDDKNPIDLTEAWVEYRPYPRAGFKYRMRLGAFYPPLSLENRALGWETPYTLTPSAIGSWIGEEIRTVGLEGQVDWLGSRLGHAFDLQLTAALFGWNDPAGTQMAAHGWALHDRQTTLFGRVGAYQPDPGQAKKELFAEIDDRHGFYVGAQLRCLDRVVLNALHYDNRADPAAFEPKLRDFAWLTKFDAVALRVETQNGWTALVQALVGDTYIAPGGFWLEWEYDSQSALIAKRTGPHMLALRYDQFAVEFRENAALPGSEDGDAWTLAYSWDRGGPWRFVLEWLRVKSDVPARGAWLGENPLATESKLELSARYLLSGSF
jgi:hypothetical protein